MDREGLPALGCIGVDFRPWRLSLRAGRAAAALAAGLLGPRPRYKQALGVSPRTQQRKGALPPSVRPSHAGRWELCCVEIAPRVRKLRELSRVAQSGGAGEGTCHLLGSITAEPVGAECPSGTSCPQPRPAPHQLPGRPLHPGHTPEPW